MRILIVEDDVDSGEALLHLLQDLGHEAKLAHHPAQALTLGTEFRPQLAILDIGLPSMSGYELVTALRAQPQLRGCRYLALTGFLGPNVSHAIEAAGFDHHLTKPLDLTELRAILAYPISRPA